MVWDIWFSIRVKRNLSNGTRTWRMRKRKIANNRLTNFNQTNACRERMNVDITLRVVKNQLREMKVVMSMLKK